MTNNTPSPESRYPLRAFMDDLGALMEAVRNDPQLNLRQWTEIRYQEEHPDITNEPERGQLLLNAYRYFEAHIVELNQAGGIVLGEAGSLVPPEVSAALYAVVMQVPVESPRIELSVPEFLKIVDRYRKLGWES